MKRNKNILVLVLIAAVLAVAAYVVMKKNPRDTTDKDSHDFAFSDTSVVTKIFIAEKTGKNVTLTKNKNGSWQVNGKFEARQECIIAILKTLKYLEVKYPVGPKALPFVIKDLTSGAIKVEFYNGEEPVRIFYVGGETQDHTGTFMLLVDHKTRENYSKPYVMGLPGFEGYLTPRFFTNENEWKDTKCLDLTPPQISNIRMDITGKPDSSFLISVKDTKTLELFTANGKPVNFKPDMMAVKQFVAYLQNLHYEKLLTGTKDPVMDSVRKTIPFATLTVTEKSGKANQFLFFFKNIVAGQAEKYGIDSPYDPDRLYVEFNNRSDFAIIQYYVFGKLLQTRQYFIPKETVKK